MPLPCPGLVELIETGDVESDEIRAYLTKLFEPYKSKRIDAVVLGCTHYPHVKALIAEQFPAETVVLDGGEGTARHTRRRLDELGLLRDHGEGEIEIINTSENENMIEISKYLLYR